MEANDLLHIHLMEECPYIHSKRLQALMDVACGLQKRQKLTLTEMGRGLDSPSTIKNRVKKVDRLESNEHLYEELSSIYFGLSSFLFKYLNYQDNTAIIIDLCCLKDGQDIQMLSAEIAFKGRSLPLYREVFKSGGFSGRAESFVSALKHCLPANKKVVFIMDAGFGEEWLNAIERNHWYWLIRIRQGKMVKLSEEQGWQGVKDLIPLLPQRTTSYDEASIMKEHDHPCRVITTRKAPSKRKKPIKAPRNDKAGSNKYRRSASEPWILATNLPKIDFETTKVVQYYSKRMQIEQSFRDVKNHQFGLCARDIRTRSVYRWGVKMLLASIVQLLFWIIGVIGHSQGFQSIFQANTVKDKKVFSYFYLGQLIVEYNKLNDLIIDYEHLPTLIEQELAKKW
ncbi:TPA: IS4 family transposase [Legionella pneumophila subsp. pneumophila]|nr:IS4 family transposase [Legionella pneumophila subsp. pneumophila]HEI6746172.1 IS4 family transposase [Legionella pneumophila]